MKMSFSRSLLLLTQLTLINFVSFTISQIEPLDYFCNYTSSATYQTNRDTLLSSLHAGVGENGYFYSSSHGVDPDKVYAMVLCRADAELDLCRECINNAITKLGLCPANKAPTGWPEYNPSDKEGIVWYDNCTVRYSSKAMEGIMAGDPRAFVNDDVEVEAKNVEKFTDALRKLLKDLQVQAAKPETPRRFASGNAFGADNTIYALTQCTPDLSEQDCTNCLQGAIDNIPICCNRTLEGRTQGGRVTTRKNTFGYIQRHFLVTRKIKLSRNAYNGDYNF